MEILKDRYTITELSEILGITDHALRYYEKEFQLHVPKDERGRRYYTTELANIMYQVKAMRDDGLEIKAIRKILQTDNIINHTPPIYLEPNSVSIIPLTNSNNREEIKQFFDDFKEQITTCLSEEVGSVREHMTKEITKSKLELGACVENSIRKLESKMEKHFHEVDQYISNWREKNKKGITRRLIEKLIK